MKFHSLIDKVYSIRMLKKAYRFCARKNSAHGADGVSWYSYRQNLNENITVLSGRIRSGSYYSAPYRVIKRKDASGKVRNFYIPTVEDRLVQRAIRYVIEPLYENIFHDCSLEYRPNRGIALAPEIVKQNYDAGKVWIADADVRSFCPEVNRQLLDECLAVYIADGKLLRLIQLSLGDCEEGLPIGNGLSPFLSNVYLHQIDSRLINAGISHIRLCDRFLLFVSSEATAYEALLQLHEELATTQLDLNEAKTKVWYAPAPYHLFPSGINLA